MFVLRMFTDPRKDKQVHSYLWELCSNRGANGTDSAKGSVCYSLLPLLFFVSFHVGCVFIHTDVPVNSQGHNWNVLEYSGYANAGKFISVVFTFDELYCTIIRSQYGYKCQSDYR